MLWRLPSDLWGNWQAGEDSKAQLLLVNADNWVHCSMHLSKVPNFLSAVASMRRLFAIYPSLVLVPLTVQLYQHFYHLLYAHQLSGQSFQSEMRKVLFVPTKYATWRDSFFSKIRPGKLSSMRTASRDIKLYHLAFAISTYIHLQNTPGSICGSGNWVICSILPIGSSSSWQLLKYGNALDDTGRDIFHSE